MKMIVMCGLPNSGKSTLAKELSSRNETEVIEYDKVMCECMPLLVRNKMKHDDVPGIVYSKIREILLEGSDIIYDSTNPTEVERKTVLDTFRDIPEIEIVCMYVDTPADICIKRSKHGGYITKAYMRFFQPPTEDEGFDEIIVYHDDVEEPEPERVLNNSERISNLETAVEELRIIDDGAKEIMDILGGNAE